MSINVNYYQAIINREEPEDLNPSSSAKLVSIAIAANQAFDFANVICPKVSLTSLLDKSPVIVYRNQLNA